MDSQGSEENLSWTTISSVSDEYGYSSSSLPSANTLPEHIITNQDQDMVDASLDDTIPLDELDEANLNEEWKSKKPAVIQTFSQNFSVWTDCPAPEEESPAVSKNLEAPVMYPSSRQLQNSASGSENRFLRSYSCLPTRREILHCSSHLKTASSFSRQPASSEISNFNPPFNSTALIKRESDLSEFKPQRCSTAINESSLISDFKPHRCSSALGERSALFVPLRSSTGLSDSAAFNPPFSSTTTVYQTPSLKPAFQENSTVFVPLRTSTGLNDSATFNPPLSSTAYKIDDSNIPEFKNLRVFGQNGSQS